MISNYHNDFAPKKSKIVTIYQIEGLTRVPVTEAKIGDIVCFSGAENINIGDTVTSLTCIEPLEFVKVSPPTIEMTFAVNDSPFAGKEGKFVTSRQLRDRLYKELLSLLYTEPVLLIRNDEAEVFKNNVALNNCVRTD